MAKMTSRADDVGGSSPMSTAVLGHRKLSRRLRVDAGLFIVIAVISLLTLVGQTESARYSDRRRGAAYTARHNRGMPMEIWLCGLNLQLLQTTLLSQLGKGESCRFASSPIRKLKCRVVWHQWGWYPPTQVAPWVVAGSNRKFSS